MVVGTLIVLMALLLGVDNLTIAALLFAAGLDTFLYTRRTAQKTIAASVYGAGVVMISLFVLELYWNGE